MKTVSLESLEVTHPHAGGYLSRTLELAQRVVNTSPNPRVGCVIVKGEEVLAEGWHVAPGLAHAEAMALSNLQHIGQAAGATVFVSLEPCSFVGRTPACSQSLIDAGVSTVIIAALDPNPRVSGSGVAMLEAAGIETFHVPEFEQRAWQINPGYRKRMQAGLPFVRCKMAMSLDGRTALANGSSKWITGTEARRDVHSLRASCSAVVTGIGTILCDDPSMNARPSAEPAEASAEGELRQPLRVILDSRLRTPATAKTLSLPGDVKIYAIEGQEAERPDYPANVEIVSLAAKLPQGEEGNAQLDLQSVLESLAGQFQIDEVFLEAGPTLAGAFVQQNLIDELIVYIAPRLFGDDARPLFQLDSISMIAEGLQLELTGTRQCGSDIRLCFTPGSGTS